MESDFSEKGRVKIGMIEYVKNMLKDFPDKKIKSTDIVVTPASDGLFNEGQEKKLSQEHARAYHTMVTKRTILMQACRTRHTACNCCSVQEGQGPE
jgi:hypothetical protein